MPSWLAVMLGAVYYVFVVPVVTVVDWIFLGLAPILHLLHYALHALYVPFSFIARFETLYIYLGVAALVGVIAGSVLHFTSSVLISVLGLRSPSRSRQALRRPAPRPLRSSRSRPTPSSPVPARTLKTSRSKRQGQTTSAMLDGWASFNKEPTPLKNDYTDWLQQQQEEGMRRRRQAMKKRKEGSRGLVSETIMEEEDSDGAFDPLS